MLLRKKQSAMIRASGPSTTASQVHRHFSSIASQIDATNISTHGTSQTFYLAHCQQIYARTHTQAWRTGMGGDDDDLSD
jgi:hypothetical protein